MKRLFGLLSVLALLVLAGCDTSNPMRSSFPVKTGMVTTPVVVPSGGNMPSTPKPISKPKPTGYTLQDVQKHSTETNCRTVIAGNIYNVSSFASQHSGGPSPILAVCGKDGTAIFQRQHGTNYGLIASFFVAKLQ